MIRGGGGGGAIGQQNEHGTHDQCVNQRCMSPLFNKHGLNKLQPISHVLMVGYLNVLYVGVM